MPDMRYELTVHATEVLGQLSWVATLKGRPMDPHEPVVTLLRRVAYADMDEETEPARFLRDALVAIAEAL